jgi:hypothetical protein
MSEKTVYALIQKVSAEMSRQGIAKSRTNTQGAGFKFRGIDEVLNALSGVLADVGLVILPRVVSRECVERTSAKGGALFFVNIKMEFDFVSALDGSKHTVCTFGEAMDSGDKATNKAMSVAYKYAAIQAFCIPIEGLPEADQETHFVANLPEYPQSDFAANLPKWKEIIASGKKSAEDILSVLSKKYMLTTEQIQWVKNAVA